MGRLSRLVGRTLLVALAGCTAAVDKARGPVEQPQTTGSAPDSLPEAPTSVGGPASPPKARHFTVTVTDRFDTVTVVTDAVLFVPEFSILGNEGGESRRTFPVKRG